MRRVHFDITDSTNTQAAALAQQHPGEPILVTAAQQTAGRGRTGRPWQSPIGGAWFTLAWPTHAPPTVTASAPIVTGLAVLEVVSGFSFQVSSSQDQDHHTNPKPETPTPKPFTLKWPNDILLHDRKLAGILCEQTLSYHSTPRTILLGVGINANITLETFDGELHHPATSLQHALGQAVDITALIDECAAAMIHAMQTLEQWGLDAQTVQHLNHALAWRGRRVALRRGAQRIEGVLQGIDAFGRALIGDDAYEAGEVEAVTLEASSSHAG